MPTINKSYDKASKYPVGYGYGLQYDGGPSTRKTNEIYSIIIHTTNGKFNSSLSSELNYLFTTPKVSSHYLVGKNGNTYQTLNPLFIAWHAGDVMDSVYNNYHSIGIENHFTPGEVWTPHMHTALTELVDYLLDEYPSIKYIDTHRRVAIPGPNIRKKDPSGWSDKDFYVWRDERLRNRGLIINTESLQVPVKRYRVLYNDAIIREGASRDYKQAQYMNKGDFFTSISIKKDEKGQVIGGYDEWIHVTQGTRNDGVIVDNSGFIHASSVKLIG